MPPRSKRIYISVIACQLLNTLFSLVSFDCLALYATGYLPWVLSRDSRGSWSHSQALGSTPGSLAHPLSLGPSLHVLRASVLCSEEGKVFKRGQNVVLSPFLKELLRGTNSKRVQNGILNIICFDFFDFFVARGIVPSPYLLYASVFPWKCLMNRILILKIKKSK